MFDGLKERLKNDAREDIGYYKDRILPAQEFLQIAYDNDDADAMKRWSKVLREAIIRLNTCVTVYKLFGGGEG